MQLAQSGVAQRLTFDKNGVESDTGQEVIYFLSTLQSKISPNSQTKDDTFVTTEVGYRSFHVLNAIHSPFRKKFEEENSNCMFANLVEYLFCKPVTKEGIGKSLISNFNRDNFDFAFFGRRYGVSTSVRSESKPCLNRATNFISHLTRLGAL